MDIVFQTIGAVVCIASIVASVCWIAGYDPLDSWTDRE